MESAASMTGTPRVETLGQLVGQFAHDLNNQLAIALASVELASRLDDRDKVRQLLARAVEAIERQRILLEAMANASAASARPEACDVHALLEDVRMRLPARIVLKPAAADATVLCDRAFLCDALLHLLAQGGTHDVLTIETSNGPASRLDASTALVLVVTPLEPPERGADRAFAPFGGTDGVGGLGLAQVHDTVRRIGGRADFEPGVGEMSGLRLVLPLAASAQVA
jgi:signal transduction histidine kinase